MKERTIGWVQIAALVVALTSVAWLFWRQENNTHDDLRESRRTDLSICEGGQRLADGQRRNIDQLADIALLFARDDTDRSGINLFRKNQLANVPVFDCDSLPRP